MGALSNTPGFDAGTFPLLGRRLIEASAGTGKTYNIANLYLRLVLGDGFTPLTVDQILVVTFTKAATEELRGRIREKMEEALQAFRRPEVYTAKASADQFIKVMLERFSSNEVLACRYLNAALVCMDEASIYTIHGFSVRAIQSFLFETGALAEVELSEAGNERKERAIADLWRQLQLSKNPQVIEYFSSLEMFGQDKFHAYFRAVNVVVKVVPNVVLPATMLAIDDVVDSAVAQVAVLKNQILAARKQLQTIWMELIKDKPEAELVQELDALFDIGKLDDEKTSKKHGRVVLGYINELLAMESIGLNNPLAKNNQTTKRIHIRWNEKNTSPYVALLRQLHDHAAANKPGKGKHIEANVFKAILVQCLQQRLATMDLSSMQLDEVIRLINQKLAAGGDAAHALRQMITDTYPVCMVDEFQDTDPQQFAMFNQLYGNTNGTGFFMIGDPKQSIYAFRGADIFSYLEVRQQVKQSGVDNNEQRIFSLDTNFRSKQQLITLTNALFAETAVVDDSAAPVFVYPGIDYVPVNSCEAEPFLQNKGELLVHDEALTNSPLVFVGNPDSDNPEIKISKSILQYAYARDTAQRIAVLLTNGKASIGKDNQIRALKAGDIAVLVRTSTEARVVRDALLQMRPRIGSVFQSQRDSVFSSATIATDIYHLLRAMHNNADKNLLKAAIATPLFKGFATDFSLLEALDNDDTTYEQLIAEFGDYKALCERFGVLTALNELMRRRQLAEGFSRQTDCDRLITDFRHLGDLLQQHYLQCGSFEQLLDWYARQLQDDSDIDEDMKRMRLESDDNLVKIVTIHVSKGLEYPVVFLPFFYLPFKADASKKLPLVHNVDHKYAAEINFLLDNNDIENQMQQEQMAEDMRLLYVAITRAVYQCYIGISAASFYRNEVFQLTAWAHLLDVAANKRPGWEILRQALAKKLGVDETYPGFRTLFDSNPLADVRSVAAIAPLPVSVPLPLPLPLCIEPMPGLTRSPWLITSYTQLAHARKEVLVEGENDELMASVTAIGLPSAENDQTDKHQTDKQWRDDIRFTLKGSANTGECLHGIYEELALNPQRYLAKDAAETNFIMLVEKLLSRYGLLKLLNKSSAEAEEFRLAQLAAVSAWLQQTVEVALGTPDNLPSLKTLFLSGQLIPELTFDFSLGHKGRADFSRINGVLNAAGLAGVNLPFRNELQGFMHGAIDLVFIHRDKVYVLDYKSNTLGKSPRFYGTENMNDCMLTSRYDLQYMIYSVAVHRYFSSRFGNVYAYDNGSRLSFGGVLYLFVRGMGVSEANYKDYGIWFNRPPAENVQHLDMALSGKELADE